MTSLVLHFLVSFPDVIFANNTFLSEEQLAYLYMPTIGLRLQVMGHHEAGCLGREVHVVQSKALTFTPKLVGSTYMGVGVVGVGQAFEALPGQKGL